MDSIDEVRTDPVTRLRAGEPVVGNWLSLADPAVAELTAALGFDFALIDLEHTSMTLETVTNIVRGLNARGDTAPVVRIPAVNQAIIKRVLDLGAAGLMAPMIDTAGEAEDLVDAMRYPPEGSRGVATGRATTYGLSFDEYVGSANEELLTIAQIESETAVENAADIAAVDGIDALFVGPADLSTSLGVTGETESEAFVDAVATVLDAGESADIPVGMLALEADDIQRWADVGFDFQISGVDFLYVSEGSQQALAMFEDAMRTGSQ